jgi:hypothetical protein
MNFLYRQDNILVYWYIYTMHGGTVPVVCHYMATILPCVANGNSPWYCSDGTIIGIQLLKVYNMGNSIISKEYVTNDGDYVLSVAELRRYQRWKLRGGPAGIFTKPWNPNTPALWPLTDFLTCMSKIYIPYKITI